MLTSTVLECATDSTEGQLTRGAKISLSSGTAMLVSLASVEQYREPSTKVGRDRVALRLRRGVPVRVWGRPTNGLRLPTEIALFGCPISPSIRCSIRFARKSASGVCFGASVWPGKVLRWRLAAIKAYRSDVAELPDTPWAVFGSTSFIPISKAVFTG